MLGDNQNLFFGLINWNIFIKIPVCEHYNLSKNGKIEISVTQIPFLILECFGEFSNNWVQNHCHFTVKC